MTSSLVSSRSGPGQGRQITLAVLACALTTLVCTPLLDFLDLANIVMLFLLTVLLVAARLGLTAALVAAFLSVGLFDFFFVPPRFSFEVSDGQYLVTFVVMLAVAVVTSTLAADLRRKAQEAGLEARRSRALYEMARELSGALAMVQVVEITRAFLREVMNADGDILLADRHAGFRSCADNVPVRLQIEPRLASIAFERGEVVHCDPLSGTGCAALYLPLNAPTRIRGVIAVAPVGGDIRELMTQQERLGTLASLVAISIERIHYVDVAQRTQVDIVSERLRSSILSAVSHDLRTPLTALVGLADSLVEQRPPLDATAKETALAIRDQSEYLAGLVANLLDMARLHAGKVTLRKEWQPVEEVIGSSIKLLARILVRHPVSVQLQKALPLVEFDAVLIERVFCNLLENAAKYSPEGQAIRIEALASEGHLQVRVIDRGPGFAGDAGAKLFDMFVRGERESSKPGVGLGLAICRAVIEAHGGRIGAENPPEGGACVSFTLPLGTPPTIVEELPGGFDGGVS